MRFTYDNSTNNPHNPHEPPVRVRYGVETTDEMAELWLQTMPRNSAELPRLREEVEKQTFDYAISFAEYRLRQDPKDAKAHLKYAQALLAKGRRRDAVSHLVTAVQVDPGADEPRYFLGVIARMENQPETALRHFQEAGRLNPKNEKAFGNLGLLYLEKGNLAEAEKNFAHALEIDPEDAIAHDGLGVIYARQGKLARAEAHLRKAAAAAPEDKDIRAHLSQVENFRRAQQPNGNL